MISMILNGAIFVITAVIVTGLFRKDGHWDAARGKKAFRFFTVLSNVLCAFAALLICVSRTAGSVPRWIWLLKYAGTAAVTVTMLTVFLFLGPSTGKLKELLSGLDFFMHLFNPLLAIVSFCFFEKQPMGFGTAPAGLLPVLVYGPLYLYKIRFAPEGTRWDDFYGFNKNGKWPVMFAVMLAGTFLVCMGLMLLSNL